MSSETPPVEPKVYIVIVNWNGWKDTIECLESVFRQRYGHYQVVVCDNASANDSLAFIRQWAVGEIEAEVSVEHPLRQLTFPPIAKPLSYAEYTRAEAETVISAADDEGQLVLIQTGANLGFAGGNNVGLRYVLARGDAKYIWLLNNDTVIDANALASAVALAETDEAVGMVGAKLLHYDRPEVIQTVAGGRIVPWQAAVKLLGRDQEDLGQWDDPVDIDYITGASLLVKDVTLRATGLIDEQYFMYAEELDWCLRARQLGWRLRYSPESIVWHKEGSSVGFKSPLHDYYAVRSALLWVKKFYPRALPAAMAYLIYQSVLPKILRRQPARLAAVLRAYRSFFTGSPA